jgi:DNA-binding transcriptional regulator YhcF (GntR family)
MMKLTSRMLRKIVVEEMKGFGSMGRPEDEHADEVDADEYAETLEKHVDHAKALKTEEARLARRLRRIKEQRTALVRRMIGR